MSWWQDLKVGDTVIVTDRYDRTPRVRELTVQKVGRTWITVGSGYNAFRIDRTTGGSEGGAHGVYPSMRAYHEAMWVEAHLHTVRTAVSRVRDQETLQKIAKLVGLALPPVEGA